MDREKLRQFQLKVIELIYNKIKQDSKDAEKGKFISAWVNKKYIENYKLLKNHGLYQFPIISDKTIETQNQILDKYIDKIIQLTIFCPSVRDDCDLSCAKCKRNSAEEEINKQDLGKWEEFLHRF